MSSSGPLRSQQASDTELISRLYRQVLRAFYDDKFIVLLEQLLRFTILPQDVLAARLGIHSKDLQVLALRLVDDKMLCCFKRSEKREEPEGDSARRFFKGGSDRNGERKHFPRSYYYLHPPLFLASLKYRLHHMRLHLDSTLSAASGYTASFVCPRCSYSYSTLDVAHLLDFSTNSLRCERPGCGAELAEDDEGGEEDRKGKERMRRFNEQCSTFVRGLEALEGVRIEVIDPADFLSDTANYTWTKLDKYTDNSSTKGEAFPDYNSLPNAKGTRGEYVAPKISLADENSEEAARRIKEEEGERQRKENAIPEWLGKSTVSGEETALGARERRERERREDGGSIGFNGAAQTIPEGDDEDDYYKMYEAMQQQVQAQNAVPSSASTPSTSTTAKRHRSDSPIKPDVIKTASASPETKKVRRGDESAAIAIDDDDDDEDDEDFEEVV